MSTPGSSSSSGDGEQPAFEPGVLHGAQLAGVQLDRGELGALALDRVQHRALQHLGFDAPLDQVVLRSGGHRRHPEVLVGQSGQHDDRHVGVALRDAVERLDPVGVGKVEVQQHAVRPGGGQLALGVRHRLRPHHAMSAAASAISSSTSSASARSSSTSSTDSRRPPAVRTGAGSGAGWVCGSIGARMGDHVLLRNVTRSRDLLLQ